MPHAVRSFVAAPSGAGDASGQIVAPALAPTGRGVAELRLVCLVRSGDRYVLRGAGRWTSAGGVPAQVGTAQVDICFGDVGDRRTAAALDAAVRFIQRWCELGTTVALLDTGAGVTLQGEDGAAVPLPRSAA